MLCHSEQLRIHYIIRNNRLGKLSHTPIYSNIQYDFPTNRAERSTGFRAYLCQC